MLDRWAQPALKPALKVIARGLLLLRLSPNGVTAIACVVGLLAAIAIAQTHYGLGLLLLLISRILDGVDGTLARISGQSSDAGGFLDITLDFVFYASIVLAFAWANPQANALAAATLLACFVGTGTSFLAFAVLAAKRGMQSTALPDKSFYFLGGITEATETITLFVAMCWWPQHFSWLAYTFAALCLVTIATRIGWGYQTFR